MIRYITDEAGEVGIDAEALDWTERESFVEAAVTLGKEQILHDMAAGVVPPAPHTFAELHDHVDANEYGGLCLPLWPQSLSDENYLTVTGDAGSAMSNAVQDRLDAWLRGGAL